MKFELAVGRYVSGGNPSVEDQQGSYLGNKNYKLYEYFLGKFDSVAGL